jgi:hypothetical protein
MIVYPKDLERRRPWPTPEGEARNQLFGLGWTQLEAFWPMLMPGAGRLRSEMSYLARISAYLPFSNRILSAASMAVASPVFPFSTIQPI